MAEFDSLLPNGVSGMGLLHFWKTLPPAVRSGPAPWLAIALGLHSLLLFLPIWPAQKATDPGDRPVASEAGETRIQVTELPVAALRPPALAVPAIPPTAPPRAAIAPPPLPVQVPPPLPAAAPPAVRPVAAPRPPVPVSSPVARPPVPSPSPVAQATPSPTPTPTPEETPASPSVFPQNFHPSDAQPGCDRDRQNCWQTAETRWRSVALNFEQTLEQRGYEVQPLDDLDQDTGVRMFRISKDGNAQYYLTVVSTLAGTRYAHSEQRLSLEEINQLRAFP